MSSVSIKQLKEYQALRFCPVCGKELEVNPNTGWKACFVHGDFEIRAETVVWDSMHWGGEEEA